MEPHLNEDHHDQGAKPDARGSASGNVFADITQKIIEEMKESRAGRRTSLESVDLHRRGLTDVDGLQNGTTANMATPLADPDAKASPLKLLTADNFRAIFASWEKRTAKVGSQNNKRPAQDDSSINNKKARSAARSPSRVRGMQQPPPLDLDGVRDMFAQINMLDEILRAQALQEFFDTPGVIDVLDQHGMSTEVLRAQAIKEIFEEAAASAAEVKRLRAITTQQADEVKRLRAITTQQADEVKRLRAITTQQAERIAELTAQRDALQK